MCSHFVCPSRSFGPTTSWHVCCIQLSLLPAWRMTYLKQPLLHTSDAVYTCRAGSHWPALACIFSQSCCVEWLWMGGWKWQNLTNHSRVISFCERGWTESSPTVRPAVCSACGNATDFPGLVFLCLFLLFPPVLIVLTSLNLSPWCCLSPFHVFPPPLSCISFSYSFSFHPSLWDNIHRTC